MRFYILILQVIVVLLAVQNVFAQTQIQTQEREPKEIKERVIYRKSQLLQFSGSKLKGQYKKPELSYIYERKGIKQEQIIHIPDDFDREIIDGTNQF